MSKSPADQIEAINKKYQKVIPTYLKSKAFEEIAMKALEDFIKRVKRSLMPDLSKIPELSDSYIETRQKYKANLGKLAKASKSNATATGQMLDSMIAEVTVSGFALIIQDTARNKELSGASSKLTNAEVAGYYALNRPIFEFSKPELQRIIRNIRADLIERFTKTKIS